MSLVTSGKFDKLLFLQDKTGDHRPTPPLTPDTNGPALSIRGHVETKKEI
jgi:hypothetical protein